MATVKLYIDTRTPKKDGTCPIKIAAHHKGDIMIATGISILPYQWIGAAEQPTDNKRLNTLLNQMLTQARAIVYTLRADGRLNGLSKAGLADALRNAKAGGVGDEPSEKEAPLLAPYYRKFTEGKIKGGTRSVYENTLNQIAKYSDLNALTFEQIDLAWLRGYETNLRSAELSTNYIAIHLRNLRAVFNAAIDDEVIDQNAYPFRKFKIKHEETRKRSLTVEQLRDLRDYPCEEHQERYRDLFLLTFYLLGINAVDLFGAKELTNGRIEYRRAKTGRLYSIKVEPEAMAIIDKYRGKGYLLDVCDIYGNYKDFLSRMNRNLKQIGEMERVGQGGKKVRTALFPDLSTYWARHTWATVAADLDVPDETISLALGHAGANATTNIYINRTSEKWTRRTARCLTG